MGLIDDQERITVFAGQVLQSIMQLREQAGQDVGRFDLQGQQDLGV